MGNCEKIHLEVEAHSGEQRSPSSIPALFDPCAKERDPNGEPSALMKQNIFISQREGRGKEEQDEKHQNKNKRRDEEEDEEEEEEEEEEEDKHEQGVPAYLQ